MKNIRSSVELLFSLLMKWRVPTIIIAAALLGWSAYYFTREYDFSPAEIAIVTIGYMAALASLKVFVLISIYPLLFKSAFDGSHFIMALLTALILVFSVGSASILVARRVDTFPIAEIVWLLPLMFAVYSLFFFATYRLSHWMFKP